MQTGNTVKRCHSFIHSLDGLSFYRSTTSPKASSCASSFNLQCPRLSLRSYASCLHLLPHLPVTSILPPIIPHIICFRCNQSNPWSFNLLYTGCSVTPWHNVIPLLFSHCRSNWSSPSSSSTPFQSFHIQPCILWYLPTVLSSLMFTDIHAIYWAC